MAAACCSVSVRTATLVWLSEGDSRSDVEFVKLAGISNGFGNSLLPETGFELFHNAALCILLGDALCELAWGGMRLGGERGIVGFRMDLTEGGKADCIVQALVVQNQSLLLLRGHTWRRLPAASLSASRPPGPMLLLRGFLDAVFSCAAAFNEVTDWSVIFSLALFTSGKDSWAIDLWDCGAAPAFFGLW